MPGLQVGERAPGFRLPSAQGPIVDLDDFLGRTNVILWFTKGFGCPFCRQQMSHLIRGLPRFREMDAAPIVVTRTPLARARTYARLFALPLPYLCDPDTAVRRRYRLDQAGIVRFAKAGGMRADGGLGEVWQLPTTDEIVGALREARSSPR
ncbi:MAG: redoxin domain-containing protein [Candidatus Rokubacteria bacterium]|nr:redoxin domain-containing protein [Candidatus Rokubacteria bacterium]